MRDPDGTANKSKRGRGKSPAKQAHQAQLAEKRSRRKLNREAGERSALQIAQAKEREQIKLKDRKLRQQRYEELKELRTRAVQAGLVEHGLNPVEVLQRLIDDAFIAYVLAQQDVDEESTKKYPDQKVIQRLTDRARSLRREAAYFAGLSVQYNLQDRQTKVQEARIGLMVTVLTRVLRHPDIDLPQDKVRQIPRLMQETLQTMRQTTDEKAA